MFKRNWKRNPAFFYQFESVPHLLCTYSLAKIVWAIAISTGATLLEMVCEIAPYVEEISCFRYSNHMLG